MAFVNVIGGNLVAPSFPGFLAYTLTMNQQLQLTWASQFNAIPNQVASIMDINATGTGASLIMPLASSDGMQPVAPGTSTFVFNIGANAFTILLQDGITTLATIAAGQSYFIFLTDNTTPNGTWTVVASPGTPTVTSIAATSLNANLVIGGSPITSAGTFTFNFADDLAALVGFGAGTGIAVRTAGTPTFSWALRSVIGTAGQITVTNGNGVAGNIQVGLAANLVVTSMTAGNIAIGVAGPNIISTINTNGPIHLTPNGTGQVFSDAPFNLPHDGVTAFSEAIIFTGNNGFSAFLAADQSGANLTYAWPTSAPASVGQVMAISSLGPVNQLNWVSIPTFPGLTTPDTIPVYSNGFGSLGTSQISITAGTGDMSGITSLTTNGLLLNTTLDTISTVAGPIILDPNGANPIRCDGNLDMGLSGAPTSIVFYNNSNGNTVTLSGGTPVGGNVAILTSGIARAFGNFDGTTGTAHSAYNATIARTVAGTYTFTFPIPFLDTNYAVVGSVGSGATSAFFSYGTKNVNTCIVYTTDNTFTLADFTDVSATFYAI